MLNIADKLIIKVYLNIRGTKKENEPVNDEMKLNSPSIVKIYKFYIRMCVGVFLY